MSLTATMSVKGRTDMMYSLKQVAEAVGCHPQTLKRHIYETKELAGIGQVIGQALVFDDEGMAKVKKIMAGLPSRGYGGKSSADVQKRQDKALAMQKDGLSLSAIALELGWKDSTGALKAIRAAKKRAESGVVTPPRKARKK